MFREAELAGIQHEMMQAGAFYSMRLYWTRVKSEKYYEIPERNP